MPFPLGFNPTISPKTENPLCCIGCCSSGDVNIIDPNSRSSEGQQQQTASQTGGMTGGGSSGVLTAQRGATGGGLSPGVFAITTQPQSGSGGNSQTSCDWLNVESSIEQQVDNVAINILNSRRAGRCCAFIYDMCSPRCTANPGCPTCGCPDGETGCGDCGRLLCGILDSCCVVGAGGSRLRVTAFHRRLNQKFSGRVIALAEEETKICLQDLLVRGRGLTTDEKRRLEESCVKIQTALTLALGQSSMDNWKKNQDHCMSLLDDPGWLHAVRKAGSKISSCLRSTVQNVLIVSQCGGSSSSCAPYSASQLGSEISRLMVTTRMGVTGTLGAFEGSFIAEIINEIIFCHPTNLGNFWLSQLELRMLVSLILSIRGLSLQDTEANVSDAVNHPKIKKLRKEFGGVSNCLMMSSAPLCGGLPDSEKKVDPLIRSMTTEMLQDSLGEKTGKVIEQQLVRRYMQARQRIEDRGKQKEPVVTLQPKRREDASDDSSASIPSLYLRECPKLVGEARERGLGAPGVGSQEGSGDSVVRPKIRTKITGKSGSRSSSKSTSKVIFMKKDDESDDDKKQHDTKRSFWI